MPARRVAQRAARDVIRAPGKAMAQSRSVNVPTAHQPHRAAEHRQTSERHPAAAVRPHLGAAAPAARPADQLDPDQQRPAAAAPHLGNRDARSKTDDQPQRTRTVNNHRDPPDSEPPTPPTLGDPCPRRRHPHPTTPRANAKRPHPTLDPVTRDVQIAPQREHFAQAVLDAVDGADPPWWSRPSTGISSTNCAAAAGSLWHRASGASGMGKQQRRVPPRRRESGCCFSGVRSLAARSFFELSRTFPRRR